MSIALECRVCFRGERALQAGLMFLVEEGGALEGEYSPAAVWAEGFKNRGISNFPIVIGREKSPPRMSGFELLSVVRRRFPSIAAIAMSGSFVSDGVPPGIAADAFYEKGVIRGFCSGS